MVKQIRPRPAIIAVDGGLSFLQKIGLKPDLWLTDLDSAPRIQKGFLHRTRLLLFSSHKDKTDAELALEFCARSGVREATIFGWYDRGHETDHLLGNLFLARHRDLVGVGLTFMSSIQEVHVLRDQGRVIRDRVGCRLSVIPLGRRIRLSVSGVAFPADDLLIHEGDTRSLRNMIAHHRVAITVAGMALVVVGTPVQKIRRRE